MKRGILQLLSVLLLSASFVWVVGCTSQDDTTPAEQEMMTSTVFLRHEVADYSAWRPLYDADESRRVEAGLKEIGVYRDADNENMVLIVWETSDLAAFKGMLESPDLADKMKEAGVTSQPEVWTGKSLQGGMGPVFLKHKVADYSAWRPVYDADEPRRMEAGLSEVSVYRDTGDENMILLSGQVKDGNSFKMMVESQALADKMKEAGVISKPQVWMGESM